MSAFNNEQNYHDSKLRNIIIAVLGTFQDKLKFKQFTSSNVFEIFTIPFYYSLSGSEDYLLDNYMTSDYSALSTQAINNNYESIPRGVITMTSTSIDSGSLINKHVRTQIPKKVDETTYKMYSYETMIIPINLSFDVKITCNSNIEMLKITEVLISNMYKVMNFYVDYGGYHVRGSMVLPEEFTKEQLLEFSFTDKKLFEITFSVDVSTNFPVFDMESEMFLGDRIDSFESNIYDLQVAPDVGMYSNTANGVVAGKEGMLYDKQIIP